MPEPKGPQLTRDADPGFAGADSGEPPAYPGGLSVAPDVAPGDPGVLPAYAGAAARSSPAGPVPLTDAGPDASLDPGPVAVPVAAPDTTPEAAPTAAAFALEPAFAWTGQDWGAPGSAADYQEQWDEGQAWGDLPPAPSEPELVALRSLILSREIALLDKLKQRLDDPRLHAGDVSQVIAEALLLRAGKDDMLFRSLEPVVEGIFKSSLRRNPLDFANALFPLMGPAIRRSIAEAFRSMLEGVNKSVEMAFSWKGLRWRFEAWRSGKPFSEIVLLNTLIYRVEQIFLIHRKSGLMLVHEVNEGVESQDADMVSGMLTAIQDFVNDSFAGGAEGELESLSLGDYTLLMEKSSMVYMACLVRGQPPADFRAKVRASLEMIAVEFYDALLNFKGDTALFSLARRYLSDLMVARFVNEDRPLPLWVKALPVLLLLGIAGGVGYWSYSEDRAVALRQASALAAEQERNAFYNKMDGYLELLKDEPGLVISDVRRSDSPPWTIDCFKDDQARKPEEVLAEAGAAVSDFIVLSTPYISHEPLMVRKRVEKAVQAPEGVTVNFGDDGVLHLAGSAPMDWIVDARQKAVMLPGVKSVDLSGISDPRMRRIKALLNEVEAVSIRFDLGKDTPTAEDAPKLVKAVESLVELEKIAKEMGLAINLLIFGHTDALGNPKRNYELSQARASTLAAMLYAKGSTMPVASYGMGADFAGKEAAPGKEGAPSERRIELRVHLTRAPGADELLAH